MRPLLILSVAFYSALLIVGMMGVSEWMKNSRPFLTKRRS